MLGIHHLRCAQMRRNISPLFPGGYICPAILPPWGKIWKPGDSLCKFDAFSRAESRHGVGTRLHAGRCGRRAGRPHRYPDSRGYHFAWCHGAVPAKRYGGTRGDQTDPWNWPGEISAVPRKEWPPGLACLAGDRASCAGPTGGPRIATTGRRPEFALPRSRGSPARIHGPSDRAYIEPSAGVAQQPKGYTAAHFRRELWARDAGRPRKSNGCIPSRGAERARRGEQPGFARETGASPSAPSVRGGRMGWLTKTPSPSKAGRTFGLPCATTAPAETPCSNGEGTKQQ
jgi:hypothetical protein